MRTLKGLVLCLFFCMTSCSHGVGNIPLEAGDEGRRLEFVAYAADVAKEFGLLPPRVVIDKRDDVFIQYWQSAEVYPVGERSDHVHTPIENVQHVIRVTLTLLRKATPLAQHFTAAHEVCHIRYRHTIVRPRTREGEEREEVMANSCACRFLGKERCITAAIEYSNFANLWGLEGLPRDVVALWVERVWSTK